MLERYLIFVWGDVEPEIKGPFKDEDERNAEARRLRQTEGDENGIYPLDIVDGKPVIWTYINAFFEPPSVVSKLLKTIKNAQSQE